MTNKHEGPFVDLKTIEREYAQALAEANAIVTEAELRMYEQSLTETIDNQLVNGFDE